MGVSARARGVPPRPPVPPRTPAREARERHDCPRLAPRGARLPVGHGARLPRAAAFLARRRSHGFRDPERLAAAAAHDRGLGQDRGDDPDVAPAVAHRLDPDAAAGGAVAGGRAAEGAAGVGGRGRHVRLQRPLEALDRRSVPPLRLGAEPDQGETAARVRLLGMVQAQFLGDREEPAVVIAAGAGGVAHTARGGDAMDCLVEESLEGELVSACGRRLPDQGLRRGKIWQLGVEPLNVGPRLCQLCGENRWCRAHVRRTSRGVVVFLFRGIPNNLHVPVSCH